VKIIKNGSQEERVLRRARTVAQAIALLGLNKETLVPKLNGEVCSLSEELGDEDEIELIHIIYGG
jgi:sulfur carrier protein ThiS